MAYNNAIPKKSNPKKSVIIAGASVIALVALLIFVPILMAFSNSLTITDSIDATSHASSSNSPLNQSKSPSPESGVQSSSSRGQTSQISTSTTAVPPQEPKEINELRRYALTKINEDRAKFGLSPVLLSDNQAAQVHSNDVFATKQISHWLTNGEKPYMTYSRYGGLGNVGQNVAVEGYKADETVGCQYGLLMCESIKAKGAIDRAEHDMVYNDKECCNDGHRDNILDKDHTHVSIGITYDKYYFAFVQNFENQYVTWSDPISYHADLKEVKMSGTFSTGMKADSMQIYYDALPSNEVYLENRDRTSYDNGEAVAAVIPAGWYLENSSLPVIHASNWRVNNQDFEISFPLGDAMIGHGNGIYTVILWGIKDNGDKVPVSNTSIILSN